MLHYAAYYLLEAIMDSFFPFIYKREKKKEWEPELLYIEIEPPQLEKKQEEKKENDDSIIIIQL